MIITNRFVIFLWDAYEWRMEVGGAWEEAANLFGFHFVFGFGFRRGGPGGVSVMPSEVRLKWILTG